MAHTIKLDIISDVVCPWCIIGYLRLNSAIAELGIADKIDLEWHPFELNPAPQATGEDRRTYLMRKYGMSPDELTVNQQNIVRLGAELDFTFDFYDGQPVVHTRDAHILIDGAKEAGRQTELMTRLFTAYFSEQKDISDRQILAQEVHRVGLEATAVLPLLDDAAVLKRIQAQEAHWQELGVSAVPTVVFNDTDALIGAQPVEVYQRVLTELL